MSVLGTLYSVSAPSGAGKTSLVKALSKMLPSSKVSISYTTRPMRPGEVDGVDYHFVDDAAFFAMQQQQAFLEYATVFNYYYGTSRQWVEAQLAAGVDVILEIDWQGYHLIKQQLPHSVGVFVLPPSQQALMLRLQQRAQDSPQVIQQRLNKAQEEMSHCKEYDYIIVNDDFAEALAELQSIIQSQRLRVIVQQQRLAALIDQLLA